MVAWSYSSIKTFDQCPKKYFHLKVAKDVKDTPGAAATYGTEFHEAAELRIKDGTPIPPKFKQFEPIVEALDKFPGTKHTELQVGVKRDADGRYGPSGFFDDGVWYRGIVDLLIIDGNRAHMIDYKTGKNAKYADIKQLDLMAGAIFVHYPEVMMIKSALAYVVSGEFIKKTHVRTEKSVYLSVFNRQLGQLEDATDNGVWNPKSGPLCGWCPVVNCEHHRPRR